MSRLLALLLAFLRPAAEEPPVDTPIVDEQAADEIEIEIEEPVVEPAADDAATLRAELEAERAGRAQEREARERFEREAGELRLRQAPPPPRSAEVDEEERILRDPASTEQQKWTINANRELRANRQIAQASIATAYDVSDKTEFSALMTSNPLAKKYEARVEEKLKAARASGQNPSRANIFKYLLGEDMVDGKYQKKKPAAAAAPAAAPRGRTPGVRSDVPGKTSLTEREKRRQRLENVQI